MFPWSGHSWDKAVLLEQHWLWFPAQMDLKCVILILFNIGSHWSGIVEPTRSSVDALLLQSLVLPFIFLLLVKSEHNWLGSIRLKVFSLRHQATKQVYRLSSWLWRKKPDEQQISRVWGVWSPVTASQPQLVEMYIHRFYILLDSRKFRLHLILKGTLINKAINTQ